MNTNKIGDEAIYFLREENTETGRGREVRSAASNLTNQARRPTQPSLPPKGNLMKIFGWFFLPKQSGDLGDCSTRSLERSFALIGTIIKYQTEIYRFFYYTR